MKCPKCQSENVTVSMVSDVREKRKMGMFKKKTLEGDITVRIGHVSGILDYLPKTVFDMTYSESEQTLTFKVALNHAAPVVILPVKKISSISARLSTESKPKSKTGRAIAGGILFGGTGAVVGALTAGEKKKTKLIYIVKYHSDNEEKIIELEGYPPYFDKGIFEKIKKLLPHQDKVVL